MVTLSNTLTNGTTADASEVMANFNDLNSALQALTNANIAANAAIDQSKLAQPFSLDQSECLIIPYGQAASYAVPTNFTPLPAALTRLTKFKVVLKPGQQAFLTTVELWVEECQNGAPDDPQIGVYHNGNVLSAVVTLDTDATYYTLANANPEDNPLVSLQNGDEIEIQLGRTGVNAAVRGVMFNRGIKKEMIS